MSFDPQHVCYGCFKEKEPGTVCPKCGFNENSERPYLAVPIGTILDGRYLIGKVLGVGGFGITYLGYDLTLDYKRELKTSTLLRLPVPPSSRLTTKAWTSS